MFKYLHLTAAALSAALFFTGCGNKSAETIITSVNVGSSISTARELMTLKYEYADFGSYVREADTVNVPIVGSTKVPFTKEEFIFTYGGTICVGFDLKDIEPVVDDAAKTITVPVPQPAVLSHTPNHDADHVYAIKESVKTDTTEKITAIDDSRAQLREQKEKELMEDSEVIESAVNEYKSMCEASEKGRSDTAAAGQSGAFRHSAASLCGCTGKAFFIF